MTAGSASLIDHLERFLGEIEVGWSGTPEAPDTSFQVVRFARRAFGGVVFATIGLSKHELRSRVSAKRIRQELMMIVPSPADRRAPGLLQQVAGEAVESGDAILRGDVIGPRGRLFDGSEMEALYAAAPVYLPDDFAVFVARPTNVAIGWLVPISHSEAHFILSRGWSEFESKLAELDPDLVDMGRSPITS